MILAFKFLSKKRIGVGKYEKRELREFYKVWNEKKNPTDMVCKYDGTTYALIQGEKKKTQEKKTGRQRKKKQRIIMLFFHQVKLQGEYF